MGDDLRVKPIVYSVGNVVTAKEVFGAFLGVEPHVDSGYYAGHRVGDLEIGLDPGAQAQGFAASIAYVDTDDIRSSLTALVDAGSGRGQVRRRRRGSAMSDSPSGQEEAAQELLAETIEELGDWRGDTLARVCQAIKEADPDVVEEWKWRKPSSLGTPVRSHNGGICTGETYRQAVKLTLQVCPVRGRPPSTSTRLPPSAAPALRDPM